MRVSNSGRRVPSSLLLQLCCLFPNFGMMADVDAFHQEQHVLGNVGGVIGDALQVCGR